MTLFGLRWSPAPWSFTLELKLSQVHRYRLMKMTQILGNFFGVFYRYKRHLIYLQTQCLCVHVRHWWRSYFLYASVLIGASTTMTTPHVVQRNTQNAKLLVRRGYSTVYYAQNNPRSCEIILANEILTLLCLYLRLWSVGSSERPKMQGTSVLFEPASPWFYRNMKSLKN